METTTMKNKDFRTHDYQGPKIDITVGKTTVKMGEDFDENCFAGSCNLIVCRDGKWIPTRRIVITLELDQPPQIDLSYIEKARESK